MKMRVQDDDTSTSHMGSILCLNRSHLRSSSLRPATDVEAREILSLHGLQQLQRPLPLPRRDQLAHHHVVAYVTGHQLLRGHVAQPFGCRKSMDVGSET